MASANFVKLGGFNMIKFILPQVIFCVLPNKQGQSPLFILLPLFTCPVSFKISTHPTLHPGINVLCSRKDENHKLRALYYYYYYYLLV